MPRASSKSGKTKASAPDALPFEQAIERLEGLVERLEDGELDLEASLAAFEEGVALSKGCAGQLDAAERRIEILVKEGGETLARPFD
jgi:exodeoxyribonuclease VII small subunit